tara:strand:+ start:9149 stop:10690 length:1542 start_codon:yes stop_codon:yes gene_type:complete
VRDIVSKSVKLNRDLDRYIEKALEQDRPVKIGWGRAGDERPKNGEFGVITHLPKGARVLCLGNLGDCSGIANLGGTFTLRGSAGSMLGAFQESGKTVVEKDVGNNTGFMMCGGEISIQGSVGDSAGSGMVGGSLLVRGHAGSKLGSGMTGGSIVVMGSVGSDPGIGMGGGRIIIAGSCPPPPDGVEMRTIKKSEIKEFSDLLDPIGISLSEDALVLEPQKDMHGEERIAEAFISEGFENISLFPNEDTLSDHTPLDHYTLLVPGKGDSDGLLLRIPWLISLKSTFGNEDWEGLDVPAIVRVKPREVDLLLVDSENLAKSVGEFGNCAGLVLDISDFPGQNDAEIEAIIVSLISRMVDSSIVMLRGNIDRVEYLFRLVRDLDLDGAIVECATPCGSRLAASLPKIGLASKAMGIAGAGKFVMLELQHEPDAKDLLIAVASGCSAVVSSISDGDPSSKIRVMSGDLRGWMREIGIDRMERIGRRNLRANDFDTAAISGLRLVGYERPLKMWLDLR